MHFVELVVVNVGALDDLDLADLDVLDGVNGGNILGNLLLDNLAGEHLKDISDVGLGDVFCDDVVDSLSDDLLLGRKGVVGLSLLAGRLLGEGDHEHSQDISILGLDVRDSLDESLSLLDEGADFISSGVNTVEAGDGLSSFSLVDNELDFSPVEAVLVGGQVSLHLGDYSTANAIFDFF